MKKIFFLFSLIFSFSNTFSQEKKILKTPYEKGNGNQTATYQECLDFYFDLQTQSSKIKIIEMGLTDSGFPLHIVVFSENKNFDFKQNSAKILINNGIHPGEPDGIDATQILFRDFVFDKISAPKNTLIVTIPIYNIGGSLNRNSHSRANQNGPESYGFRGNARNYDLNRDFIKSDSRNSKSFQEIFHLIKPDVFIDNHVSNGADYQYTFTCIATQQERLGGKLGEYYRNEMHPSIMEELRKKGINNSPYVNIHGDTPEKGFSQFPDSPRYATGYTTLFNALGSVPETHMLKPYADRVKVTYEYMKSVVLYVDKEYKTIKKQILENEKFYQAGMHYPIEWVIDSTKVSYLSFEGYKADYKPSEISGEKRLFYDKKQPFTKKIPFYNFYKPSKEIIIPQFYVIPKSQWEILDLLKLNQIEMTVLSKDTLIEVESYKIKSFETTRYPYEGHYGHYNTTTESQLKSIHFYKGDILINTQQAGIKYLLETLEPTAVDSYFNWNFFDSILQQKEYYSAYVFEDLAAELLKNDSDLKTKFETFKKENPQLKNKKSALLDWVYKHSDYYEKAHLQYPIYRILIK